MAGRPTLAVAIATAGRRDVLPHTLDSIAQQTRLPDHVIVCPAAPDDIDTTYLAGCPLDVRIVIGPRGLAAQRNALLRAMPDVDIILFVDDDFLLAPDYLDTMMALFAHHAGLVMVTGRVIADGKKGPGIEPAAGRALILAHGPATSAALADVYNGYGCNMAFRWSALRGHALRFDENLPLYSWLEDVDFSRQAAPFGRLAQSEALIGVHLGTKKGRTPGVKFGYSQIANQVYLVRKGNVRARDALRKVGENFTANLVRSLWPEPHIDRRGRLRGNVFALGDALRRRLSPLRILDL